MHNTKITINYTNSFKLSSLQPPPSLLEGVNKQYSAEVRMDKEEYDYMTAFE